MEISHKIQLGFILETTNLIVNLTLLLNDMRLCCASYHGGTTWKLDSALENKLKREGNEEVYGA